MEIGITKGGTYNDPKEGPRALEVLTAVFRGPFQGTEPPFFPAPDSIWIFPKFQSYCFEVFLNNTIRPINAIETVKEFRWAVCVDLAGPSNVIIILFLFLIIIIYSILFNTTSKLCWFFPSPLTRPERLYRQESSPAWRPLFAHFCAVRAFSPSWIWLLSNLIPKQLLPCLIISSLTL